MREKIKGWERENATNERETRGGDDDVKKSGLAEDKKKR